MLKRIVSSFCALLLVLTFAVGNDTSAAANLPDAPAYLYASDCNSNLNLSGTTLICESSATGYANRTDKIVINQHLQKKNSSNTWETVNSWSTTIYSSNGSLTNYKYSVSSGTYRLKTVFVVHEGEAYETITKYSSEKVI